MSQKKSLKIAFVHPDLGIGGAERLVVDAALGLQKAGHLVDIYTSHHNPAHCFEETRDGSLRVHHIPPPFPRSIKGKFHVLFAHLRQLHLTTKLINQKHDYDVYFVDALSTCVPFLRLLGRTRVVFYCHFPDKLMAGGAFVEGQKVRGPLLKRLYRYPMDFLEEATTGKHDIRRADVLLVNSNFTARVFNTYFKSINRKPTVVYPGINLEAYRIVPNTHDPNVARITSSTPTFISLNRFEGKKNIMLAIEAFAIFKSRYSHDTRLVLAGGFDPRLEDNKNTLNALTTAAASHNLTYVLLKDGEAGLSTSNPDVLFIPNFTSAQRTALLTAPSTLALLYTPANEHFGIVPIESMACGVPVLACNSGGPLETVLESQTGWLRPPKPDIWAETMLHIASMSGDERENMSRIAKKRAEEKFGLDAMTSGMEAAVREAFDLGPVGFDWEIWWAVGVLIIGIIIGLSIGR